MTTSKLLYGPSFSTLLDTAFSRAANDAADSPESVLLFENTDAQQDAYIDRWAASADRTTLQVNTDGLVAFIARAYERLIDVAPSVGTLERQRTIEQALDDLERLDNARQYSDSFSELFRALETHGALTIADVNDALTDSELERQRIEVITAAFQHYCTHRETIAHPAAITRSQQFLEVAETTESLANAFPDIDHVIVSGYTDPSPVELAVLERVVDAFPTTVVLPGLHVREDAAGEPVEPAPIGTDAMLESALAAYGAFELDIEYVDPVDEQPLRAFSERLYTPEEADDASAVGDRITWHEAPTTDREVRHLARRLRGQLATTATEPEDIVVLAPGLLSYRDRISDVFAEYGVPHVASISILLERTYVGQAILDAAALCATPRCDYLARLVTNPMVSLEDIPSTELTTLIERIPSTDPDALFEHIDEPWEESLTNLLEQAAAVGSAEGVRALDAFGTVLDELSLRSTVDALDDEPGENASGAPHPNALSEASAVEGVRDDTARVTVGYEQRALERVRRILESLVPVLDEDTADPLHEIEQVLQGVRVPPPQQTSDGRVRVVGLEDTPMTMFSQLYVLGATRENLPGGSERPRYFQAVGEALGLFSPDQHRDLARYRFGLLLANADSAHFTTPAETMAGDNVLPSPMLEELARVADITRTSGIADEPRASREDIQRSLAGRAPDALEDPLDHSEERGVFSSAQTAAMRAGATTGVNRAAREPTAHDGQLEPATLDHVGSDLTKDPYSPSRLNTYAQCGFKYYLKKGLELSEPDELSPDVGRFAIGDVIHGTLERFYRTLLDECTGAVDLAEYDRADLEQRLLSAGEQTLDDLEERFESPFDRHQLRTVFAGLATPSANDWYAGRGTTETQPDAEPGGEGLLVRALERELSTDGSPRFIEADFGDETIVRTNGRVFPVHGRIDRVDLQTTDTGELVAQAIDYKTYETDAKDAVKGLDFQIPSYLFGARQLLADEGEAESITVDGAYRVLRPPRTVKHPASLGQRVDWDLDMALDDFLEEVVTDRIERAVTGIKSGAFHPAIVGEDAAGCHHCAFADVCDVRHHRRSEAIEEIDRLDHPTYIPADARPGELHTHIDSAGAGGDDR